MTTYTEEEEENKLIANEYKNLLRTAYRSLSDEDKKLIRLAFDTAVDAHKDQRRKSGEAYIFHPIGVAKIVAKEIGLDATAIAAALLHDVVEDTDYTIEDMERLFGKTVAKIVNGLTKISILDKEGEEDNKPISLQAENYRKMLLTLNDDVRVIFVKIADRLHNMQTMDAMPTRKQIKIASETLYIYAPLAHRIGLYNIKTELEDLGLKYTEPKIYDEIKLKINESKQEQDAYIESFKNQLKEVFDKEDFNYEIHGRSKSIYSIRRKMSAQKVEFDQVFDKFAIRVIYNCDAANEKFIAWKIYSIITAYYTSNNKRLRDWISNPKSTGYEALHTTIIGPDKRWIEVQIRSERMHEIAERGYAAHYKYKNQNEKDSHVLDSWLDRLRETLENDQTSAVDFVEDFKLNLYSKEIYVFTPSGDIKNLPKGATALDFSFSVHTEIGLKTRGIKINGRIVPLSHKLKNGDQVEVITSNQAKPTIHWLSYVVTSRAKNKIKSSLHNDRKQIAIEGKGILARKLKSQKIVLTESVVNEFVRFAKLDTSQDLYYKVGTGIISNSLIKEFAASKNNAFINFFKSKIRNPSTSPIKKEEPEEIKENLDLIVFGKDQQRLDYKFSSCCNPIPGDPVFGFTTVSDGIKVHKKTCPNALQLNSNFGYRIVEAMWIDSTQQEFRATLQLSGYDVTGVINQVTKTLSNALKMEIYSISFNTNGGTLKGDITIGVKNNNLLKEAIKRLKKIKGIDSVVRV